MIPLFKVAMSPTVSKPINDVLQSGYITQGTQVDLFETKLQEYFQNPHVLTLNSATAGLTLALRLLKQKDPSFDWPGFDVTTDVVLTPALTCFATTSSILANGAKLRWLDVDLKTANISLDHENKIIPAHGVYAVTIKYKDKKHKGMMNIGLNPTFGGKKLSIELNIFDFKEDIYENEIKIFVEKKIRNEQKFESVEELKNQLQKDEIIARKLLLSF